MIEHAYEQHPVFTTRDQCERKFDDEGRVGFCGRPRSEHMDEVHGLKIQLATALKKRDEARHGLDEWCKAAMQERARAIAVESERDALRAELEAATATFEDEQAAHMETTEALAAARRECEGLRAALKQRGTHRDGCSSYKQIGRIGSRSGSLWQAGDAKTCSCELGAALAAPADGEEGT